jgi:hypothetical protein
MVVNEFENFTLPEHSRLIGTLLVPETGKEALLPGQCHHWHFNQSIGDKEHHPWNTHTIVLTDIALPDNPLNLKDWMVLLTEHLATGVTANFILHDYLSCQALNLPIIEYCIKVTI